MSKLDAYSDDRENGVRHSNRCDCGNRKPESAEACARCTYLDGNKNTAAVISALRGTDGLSIVEMCRLLQRRLDCERASSRSMQRTLQRMLSTGRVRRYWRDGDAITVTRKFFKQGRQTMTAGNPGCWVYALNGEWRAA